MKSASTFLSMCALFLVGIAGTACENKAIGRTCMTLAPSSGMNEAIWNDQALECPTRLCIKPIREMGIDQMTAPFCTAECDNNADCSDGERRDSKNARDKRCVGGWACGIAFETGPLKCQKLCLCKDFLPASGPAVPAACSSPK